MAEAEVTATSAAEDSDLHVFLGNLRDHGYKIGTQQCIDAFEAEHFANQTAGGTRRQLKHYLAAILCGDAEQQADFYTLFDQWYTGKARSIGQAPPKLEERPGQQRIAAVAAFDRRWSWLALILWIAAMSGLYQWHSSQLQSDPPTNVVVDPKNAAIAGNETDESQKSNAASAGSDTAESESQPTIRIRIVDADGRAVSGQMATIEPETSTLVGHTADVTIGADGELLLPATPIPKNIKIGDGTYVVSAPSSSMLFELAPATGLFTQLQNYRLLLQIAVASSILGAYLFWYWLRKRRRRIVLELRSAADASNATQVLVPRPDTDLYDGRTLMLTATQARERRESSIFEVDIGATVNASIKRLGAMTPIFRQRRAMPVYLVLIDRRSPRDQCARRVDELLDSLETADVALERFYFDADPRAVEQRGVLGRQHLGELAGRYSDYPLLVFADGGSLLNPLSGRPQPFLEELKRWPERALMTQIAVDHWGDRELILAQTGFEVLPGTLDGVRTFVTRIDSDNQHSYQKDPWRPPYPALLQYHLGGWQTEDPPNASSQDQLCVELRRYLGGAGYRWLCSLSVYPQLDWHLTLYLGLRLSAQKQSSLVTEANLIDITRLPWFRQGRIPGWLRLRLMQDMTDSDQQQVRDLLRNLLEQKLEHGKGFALEVARNYSEEAERSWRAMLHNVFVTEPATSPIRDQVFVSFLYGTHPSSLQLQAPDSWRRYVYNAGIRSLGLAPGFLGLLLLALVAGAVLGIHQLVNVTPGNARSSELWVPGGPHSLISPGKVNFIDSPAPTEVLDRFADEWLVNRATERTVSPDGRYLLTLDPLRPTAAHRWARLWQLEPNRLTATVEVSGANIDQVQFSEDGNHFATRAGNARQYWMIEPDTEDAQHSLDERSDLIAANGEADGDDDGVMDDDDICPNTPAGIAVDSRGCMFDSDGDGVVDNDDICPNTRAGAVTDSRGCPNYSDADDDGVDDDDDSCPNTQSGVSVDSRGCPIDSDGDGIPDYRDKCPDSEAGAKVVADGCYVELDETVTIDLNLEFENNSIFVTADQRPKLQEVVNFLRQYPTTSAVIEGHTDSGGSAQYNQQLSEMRASSVYKYLVQEAGVSPGRLSFVGYGEANPIASNDTATGRQTNRRVSAVVSATRKVRAR